jgi:hypothetical protein
VKTNFNLRLAVAFVSMSAHCFAQTSPRPAPNTLTAEEEAQGFQLLFDGKSLTAFDVGPSEKRWTVVNGAIKTDSTQGGGRISTKEEFANFVLKTEFRADPHIHAHLWLRRGSTRRATVASPAAVASAGGRAAGTTSGGGGYELQIKDADPRGTSGANITGSLTNVGAAPPGTRILPGVWNTLEVTMDNQHLIVVYNGTKTVDAHDSRSATGHIGLELATPEDAPGENIEFRNLKVKRLP